MPVYALWAVVGLAAAGGLYRNRWWAYLLEFIFLWLSMIGSYLFPMASKPDWPKISSTGWLGKIAFAICTLYLLYLGYERYKEQHGGAQDESSDVDQ